MLRSTKLSRRDWTTLAAAGRACTSIEMHRGWVLDLLAIHEQASHGR